jgi:hypothetical protein
MEGRHIFVDALARFAEQSCNPRLTPIIRRLAAPVHVAVTGRRGVGCATVTEALTSAGVAVTAQRDGADVTAVVIAEALKPEDRAALAAAGRPALVILNKADLSGFGPGGPLASAHRRTAGYRALTGLPTVPFVALLAGAELDDELIGALRVLVDAPADLTSTDAFVQGAHPLSSEVRRRLLDRLDRFGIAHAVRALGAGVDASALPAVLRIQSQLDRVVAHVDAACAPVRYRRVQRAIVELRVLAVQSGDQHLHVFLADDDTVLAMMAAAVDAIEADGARVDRADGVAAHLNRAVHWKRYGGGPVNEMHRHCASDICRGSLRLAGQPR